MHELPVTRSILEIVLRHAAANGVERVSAIDLSIGALSDLEPEWLQSYFDHLSRGTPADGARLRIRRSPLTFRCGSCSARAAVNPARPAPITTTASPRTGSGRSVSIVGVTVAPPAVVARTSMRRS